MNTLLSLVLKTVGKETIFVSLSKRGGGSEA